MRTVLFFIFAFFYCILGPFVWLIALILRLFSRSVSDRFSFVFVKFACRIAGIIAGAKVTVKGLGNIPEDKACVFVLNHRSIFDIILTYPYMKRPTGFIAKKELGKIPLFSTWLWFANCLFLDRKDIRKGVVTMKKGVANVERGVSMAIFPEGTRNKDKESHTSIADFHEASFKLATRPNVPIVPIAVYNTENCFENHRPWMRPADVKITFCDPILPDELSKEDRKFIGKYTRNVIQNVLYSYEADHE